MVLKTINPRADIGENKKAYKSFSLFMGFLDVLKQQDLNKVVIEKLNAEIDKINEVPLKKLNTQIKRSQLKMLQIVEKEQKLVPKNYYKKTWLVLGMSAFGIPLGVIFGLTLDNMAFLGIGLPIGLAIGMAVGAQMDKKAEKEGRQINMEM
ncbi:hypothetical protein [Zunongwangia pacifica]|uniref:Uncharacterized protein n=1 Tax=Zunongwangia pacifica TaxID=2911062 RepID=A0A9X1ZPY5_9FLAO|nr:hypothetical protein [Zunongwangia pacifica]MCL6217869.1 hypothetical protein [Zunongwangia pacifica]